MSNYDESQFLDTYDPSKYPAPAITVDLVIFTVLDTDPKILLIKRGNPPYQNHWALPGGFVQIGDANSKGESLEDAAYRDLFEETNLPKESIYLDQLHTFGAVDRDPRMRVITVAYLALIRPDLAPLIRAGSDASEAKWYSLAHILKSPNQLAFDHTDIISTAFHHVRQHLHHTSLAFELVPPTFTVTELRSVYEAFYQTNYDPSNFRRKFKSMLEDGLIVQAPGKRLTTSRPAKVYSFVR